LAREGPSPFSACLDETRARPFYDASLCHGIDSHVNAHVGAGIVDGVYGGLVDICRGLVDFYRRLLTFSAGVILTVSRGLRQRDNSQPSLEVQHPGVISQLS
jgi:hypothetical protein